MAPFVPHALIRGARLRPGAAPVDIRLREGRIAEIGEHLTQQVGVEREDARVELADLKLLLGGLLVLDDREHVAGGLVAHDAAVSGRIGRFRHQHRQSRIRCQQALQRGGRDQRHIAVQHQHGRFVGNRRDRLLHGVAGAQLPVLQHPLQIALIGKGRLDCIATMPMHDMDALRSQSACGIDHV